MCALMELRFNANLPCLVNLAFIDAYTLKKKYVFLNESHWMYSYKFTTS